MAIYVFCNVEYISAVDIGFWYTKKNKNTKQVTMTTITTSITRSVESEMLNGAKWSTGEHFAFIKDITSQNTFAHILLSLIPSTLRYFQSLFSINDYYMH